MPRGGKRPGTGGARKGAGRPATGSNRVAIASMVPKDVAEALRAEARRLGTTVSMIVRRILEARFGKRG